MLQIAFQIKRESKLDNEVAIGGLEPSLLFDEGAAEWGGIRKIIGSLVNNPKGIDKNNIGTGEQSKHKVI